MPDAGRDGGVEEVDVEAHMQVDATGPPLGDALGQERGDAALVDRPHVDDVDAVRGDAGALAGVDRAGAEEVDVAVRQGVERAPGVEDRRERGVAGEEASAMPCMLPEGVVSGVL